jgi:hypothetical protein
MQHTFESCLVEACRLSWSNLAILRSNDLYMFNQKKAMLAELDYRGQCIERLL